MLRKLLVTSLLFIALFTVSCEKVKEAAGEITGTITGIDKAYAGTWNAETTDKKSVFYSSTMDIKEDGSMIYHDMYTRLDFPFEAIEIFKLGNKYSATSTEKDSAGNVTVSYTIDITFESESKANITYTKKEGEKEEKYSNGIFNKQAQ
ncbi:hypothetical protein [uncultured Brachyspira sp.]|uniref:hypothetical protein n=1 Tax=uncultured Brachyspira sp. TaxID=221953 RepID=UPI002625F010|nr:hypothetical protein [uncultured Brachyspira sp.]